MLDKELEKYSKEDIVPFHMPGHKRVSIAHFDPYSIDITEIPGFDDLHDARGVLASLQDEYARLYGASHAFLSVNGSTLGNLAAIFAATERGDEIIAGSNCHRSVAHAAELRGLKVHYIDPVEAALCENAPDREEFCDHIPGEITVDQVRESIKLHPEARLLVITSPTYEGIVSDIDEIVRIAHDSGVPVHLDGAHGAHHGLGGLWPRSIISSNADTAVLSLHKTLPAFTGSSVLLLSHDSGISKEKLDHYIDCFETSSPSYILMYGMAACLDYLQKGGSRLFDDYAKRLKVFYDDVEDLKKIRVRRFSGQDISKIVISGCGNISGEMLSEKLRMDHGVETERTGETYCLALSSVMDERESFKRLSDALITIDGRL